ncbi:exoglucanase repeat family protein [Vanderwaltozyma polyspora DSM 70294]|uniref:Exoglucanase repeat family protein n=1 Tax=Vanderwaltozyma polyspora (strain ATCC 22028 / DSM 70294 / BCRC 21397 / CBS 2163 / NBRC 10782 / NRRL Y-8283 / UCD 57-17) TaxID=436907 RepID=A7TPJ4_VANPO|nr:exoglucanase repeat family protein [Vanderwaltozyma polyspora DSM 70294]EDO15838.1 exoglucanase repeat family protein [Vanderwaltozyma polyspora DSM 70294]
MLALTYISIISLLLQLTLGSESNIQASKPESKYFTFAENGTHLKGITLGGWLVTEPYITPSLYKNATKIANGKNSNITIVDEYTLCQALGSNDAKALLDQHYKTWITEDDFKQISNDGFNAVKIPIGYWAWKLEGTTNVYPGNFIFEDPYVGTIQYKYLSNAFNWAGKYNLQIVIDLHGVPGSQNGFTSSGQKLDKPTWLEKANSTEVTSALLMDLFQSITTLGNSSIIAGLELVNAPLGSELNMTLLTEFYENTLNNYEILKNKVNNPDWMTNFIIHDAFQSIGYWSDKLNPYYANGNSSYFKNKNYTFKSTDIIIDHHNYQVFSESDIFSSQYIRLNGVSHFAGWIGQQLSSHRQIIGAWSGALTDCATWLNGVDEGARYDGTFKSNSTIYSSFAKNQTCISQNSIGKWPKEYKKRVRQFIEAQLSSYTSYTNGWFFTNWKTENAPEWDYQQLKKNGLFPHPFNNLKYFDSDGKMKASLSSSLYSEYQSGFTTTLNHVYQTGFYKNASTTIKSHSILSSIFVWSLMFLCFALGIVSLF